jgi:SET domain-containing protein
MSDDTLKPIAQGIVPLVTNLTHSCESNTTYFVYNGEFHIKATKDLKAGEELTTGYVYGGDDIDTRRSKLEDHYGFKCECMK